MLRSAWRALLVLLPFAQMLSAATLTVSSTADSGAGSLRNATIAANGSSVFEANRGAVPVKFDLKIDGTSTCQLPPATIALTRTSGAAAGPVNWESFDLPSDEGANFRAAGCRYLYNVDAKGLGAGTYRVEIIIDGVAAGGATFGLR